MKVSGYSFREAIPTGGMMMTKSTFRKLATMGLTIGSLVFCASLTPTSAREQADNTKMNKDQSSPTADDQKMNPTDRALAQKIRKSIHDDKELSTYAHNIKIIAQNGKVTLRGPVRSEDEKNNLQAKAVAVAGDGNVMNQLDIAPSK
jgi:hyperosmotically inducible periplasmic protein